MAVKAAKTAFPTLTKQPDASHIVTRCIRQASRIYATSAMIVDTARRSTTRLSTTNTDRATLTFLEAAVLVDVCHWSGDDHRSEDRKNYNGESHFVEICLFY
jgi:hypothetical protein